MKVSRIENSLAESAISVIAAPGLPPRRVEAEVADSKLGRALHRAAAHQGAQARQELRVGEGLGQVVVGALVESRDPISDGVARGQHQDRRPDALRAQAADRPRSRRCPGSITSRMIASYSVASARAERVLAIARDVDGHALLAKAAPDQAGHLDVIFDDQNAHSRAPGAARPRR